jgi:predicted transcriptional regulator
MSTANVLRLPPELRARIERLAEAAGKTPHAWMVEALRVQAALADRRREFLDEARRSAADVDAGGPVFALDDVAAYFKGRLPGGR